VSIEVAAVLKIYRVRRRVFSVGEYCILRRGRVQVADAERGGLLCTGGEIEGEPLDGELAFPAAEVVKPDEAEGEHGVDV
jgi:hypothetical protein